MERRENQDVGKYKYAESPIHYSRLALVDPTTGYLFHFQLQLTLSEKVAG
jgi:hypothetical protein